MSLASKSNAMEMAVMEAKEAIEKKPDAPVPLVIRNAPTRLMKALDYGKGYQYAHDYAEKITAMECLPEGLKDGIFTIPPGRGRRPGTGSGWSKSAPGKRRNGRKTRDNENPSGEAGRVYAFGVPGRGAGPAGTGIRRDP